MTFICLVIGIAGYAKFEGMSLVDAYVNAPMICRVWVQLEN